MDHHDLATFGVRCFYVTASTGASNALVAVGSLSMATQWSDGCYFVDNFRAAGNVRFSARPENTSARAPGNLQSIAVREFINEHVSAVEREMMMGPLETHRHVPYYASPSLTFVSGSCITDREEFERSSHAGAGDEYVFTRSNDPFRRRRWFIGIQLDSSDPLAASERERGL